MITWHGRRPMGGIQVHYIEIFICAAASWFVACLFAALRPREAAANSTVAGVCCALLGFLLSLVNVTVDVTLLIFIPLAIALPIQKKWDAETKLMALLTALGAYDALSLLLCRIHEIMPKAAVAALAVLITTMFSVIAYFLRDIFPPEDWREYFSENSTDRMPIHRWHFWLVLGVMAGLETALRYTSDVTGSFVQTLALFAVSTAIYWGAMYTVHLIVVCRREKLTVLVDQSYHNEMQSFMSVIRSQRHDYNFHVQTLSGLMDAGNIDECREYLYNLVRDSSAMNTILPVKDPAIAALIFSFRTMALEDGIELHLDIQNDLSCVVTSVYETNKIIGNLLQNAIDEVRTHKDKSYGIHLYIIKRGENCIIHVTNKISPKVNTQSHLQEMYRPGFSTKTGHEGIGLSSIQNLLRRYRGVVYSRIEDDIIHCVAKVPLKMEGEKA